MTTWHGLEHICRTDVPLHGLTWYRLGGPARWLFATETVDQLVEVISRCRTADVPWRILGRGAHVLVPDEGFPGAVIRLSGTRFESVRFNDRGLQAGAGADFPRLVKQSIERGYAGLEALAGIPGSMGGVVRMNAGGRHGEVGQFVRSVQVLTPAGAVESRTADQIGFAYRSTRLNGCVVLDVELAVPRGDPQAARQRHREIWNEKYATQPSLSQRSSGCVFKNPPGHAAGALIENVGLKGHRVGGAEISTRHANFIVASPSARSRDVLDLMMLAKERVHQATGIVLECEVDIW
jgi:UDP-N-acetylmuramate dehydrogenase